MPLPGTKPTDNPRHRNKPTHEWLEVPDVPFVGGPSLPRSQPDGRPWPAWTKRWWATLSKMPHCALWTDADWEFAFDTAAIKAKFHTEMTAGMATEIRNREKLLGTTLDFRRDLRIRYVSAAPVADASGNVTKMDDYRSL